MFASTRSRCGGILALATSVGDSSTGRLAPVAEDGTTPLGVKLGVRSDSVVVLLAAPNGLAIDLPEGSRVHRRVQRPADVILAFFTSAHILEGRLEVLSDAIFPSGGLWIAWPKKSSGVATSITQHVVREVALPRGLVDNKICSIDDVWSGMRLVWRREMRTRGPA